MFTGIVRHVGAVKRVRDSQGRRRLCVDCGPVAGDLGYGQSVAVAGVCLTAAAVEPPNVEFDVGGETLTTTTLSELREGSRVNLEPALSASGRLDGHIMQGHVDGVCTVADIRRGEPWKMVFSAVVGLTGWMVPKGSVAVDGVSLTLTEVTEGGFAVALIPTTLEETTLGELSVGDRVNVETDVLGKYVRKYLEGLSGSAGGLTVEKLREQGFA